jgi:hypothetical protein
MVMKSASRKICPDAMQRLIVFQRQYYVEMTTVDESGLFEAAKTVATVVQHTLHNFHANNSALTVTQAGEAGHARLIALNALLYLGNRLETDGGNKFAKDVERSVAPNHEPLAICLGSNKRHRVQTLIGPLTMPGHDGCLRTFPDPPPGTGRRWPYTCPSCRSARSNARNAAVTALQRKVAAWVARGPV